MMKKTPTRICLEVLEDNLQRPLGDGMKKFIYVIVFLLCLSPLFAQVTSEGWIEEYCVPRCVAIVSQKGLGSGVVVTDDGLCV